MSDSNRQFLDRYSIAHAAVGAMFEVSRVSAPLAIGSHVGFELVEDDIKRGARDIWPDSRPDSWENHLGDVGSFTAGYYGARALKRSEAGRWVITGFVAFAAGLWCWNLLQGHSWRAK